MHDKALEKVVETLKRELSYIDVDATEPSHEAAWRTVAEVAIRAALPRQIFEVLGWDPEHRDLRRERWEIEQILGVALRVLDEERRHGEYLASTFSPAHRNLVGIGAERERLRGTDANR